MPSASLLIGLALTARGIPTPLAAAQLQPGALQEWDHYVQTVDFRMRERLDGRRPFLWTDESPDRRLRVMRSEILVAPVVGDGTQNVPSGLIHDWIGAAFIPNASVDRLLAITRDYDRYKEFYKPVVVDSRTLACTATDQQFSMVWQRRALFVKAALQGQYRAHYTAVDARRGYTIGETTQVQEIEGYGQSRERLLPPDTGRGFVWRLRSVARYEERDGGVYVELEAIALTRDIPPSLRWFVSPLVKYLSTASLATTLSQTREAVQSRVARQEETAWSQK